LYARDRWADFQAMDAAGNGETIKRGAVCSRRLDQPDNNWVSVDGVQTRNHWKPWRKRLAAAPAALVGSASRA
jgi:hypothetical protein